MEDDDLSLEEMYALSKRDPGEAYAPDKNDPPKWKKKKDKDKGKKDKTIRMKRVLVKNPDGTIGVEFQDVETGRRISNPFADNKKELTAGDYNEVFGRKKSKKKEGVDEETVESPDIKDAPKDPFDGGGSGGPVQISSRSASPNSNSKSTPSPSSANVSSFAQPEEQGDMGDDIDLTTNGGYYANQKSYPSMDDYDPQTDIASSNSGFHPIDGTAHKDLNVAGLTARANWTPEQERQIKETLAGELAGNIDLNSPEGQREFNSVMSVIENRDIANGPKSVSDVVFAPSQFSTWNDEQGTNTAKNNYQVNQVAIDQAYDNYVNDPKSNLGFTNYHAQYVNPSWSAAMDNVTNVGDHKFGTLPEYTSKMAQNQMEITPGQSDALATQQINQNFDQSFAGPVGMDIAATAPTIDTTGVQTDPSLGGFADGYAAQRDFMPTQQIKEDLNVSGPLSTVAMQNPTQAIQNQINQFNQDTINQGMDIANTTPDIAPASTTGVEDGFASAPSSFMGMPTQPSISQQDADRAFFNATAANQFDPSFTTGLMGPNNAVVPTAVQSQSFTPNMGMGFGDYVSTTQNPSLSDFEKDVADARINDQVSDYNSATIDAGMGIANTAPTVAETANAVDAFSGATDATSAGEGSGVSSTSTSGMSPGGYSSGTDSAGGFTSASSTDSSGVTSSTGTSGSGFGGFGGIFGGDDSDTDTDATSGGSDGFL